jgi:MFS family permease
VTNRQEKYPERLTFEETQAGLSRVIVEGMASQTMESLTKGVFLVGLALQLGASNFVVGLLGAIPFLSNLFQIPAILLVEKYRDRRKIVATCCFIGRSFLMVVAISSLLHNQNTALTIVIFSMAMRYCFGALANCAWNSWMRDLVPKVILGRFFSRRMSATTSISAIIGLGAGFFLDWWRTLHPDSGAQGYSILYVLGFTAAMISSVLILTIPHPRMRAPEVKVYTGKFSIRHMIKEPFKNENFRKLIYFLMSWNFAINLASPFFTVYMLKTLKYDMIFVVALTLMSQLVNALSLKIWGSKTDKYSNKTVLGICGTLFVFCIFGWSFATYPEKREHTTELLVVLHILMGFALSGVSLSTANIAMKLTPSSQATSYLAINTVMTSLAAGVAPLFGGFFADYFEDKTLTMNFHWHGTMQDIFISTMNVKEWGFFFLLAFVLGLYSLRRLALIQEEGEVNEQVVIREIMMDTGRVLKSLSTVDGLRDLTMAPMAMMVNLVKRKGK